MNVTKAGNLQHKLANLLPRRLMFGRCLRLQSKQRIYAGKEKIHGEAFRASEALSGRMLPRFTSIYVSVLLLTNGALGCTLAGVDLAAKHCPCSDGWKCETSTNRCVPGALSVSDDSEPPAKTELDAGNPKPDSSEDETCRDAARDRDGDNVPDCEDGCPDDKAKLAKGLCGCGSSDEDTDGNGTPDCLEGREVPGAKELDAGAAEPDASLKPDSGCGPNDVDCDGVTDDGDSSGVVGDHPCRDGVHTRCDDNCPAVSNHFQDDGDNDGIGDLCDETFCRSSSMLVAVGYGDQVHVSQNLGDSWTKHSPGADANLTKTPNWEDVVHARGTWLINNSNGQLITWARSRDGTTWTVRPLAEWQGITSAQSVGHIDGLWFLGSEDGRLALSRDDGRGFASIGVPNGWNGGAIESFAAHSGRLIAVGDQGQISYSDTPEDVSSWHTSRVGVVDFKQIVVVGGMWVAAGRNSCFFSENGGESWTSCGAPDGGYYGLQYSGGLWMLGNLSSGAVGSRGRPDHFTEPLFSSSTGAWPVFGDCGSGRWFAGHRIADTTDHGLRMSLTVGSEPTPLRVISGQSLPIYGITGN